MPLRLRTIPDGMRELETEMERELSIVHHEWGYRFEKKRGHFEHETRQRGHPVPDGE